MGAAIKMLNALTPKVRLNAFVTRVLKVTVIIVSTSMNALMIRVYVKMDNV